MLTSAAHGESGQHIQVNIFGDGNPANGVEDGREQLYGGREGGLDTFGRSLNSGTIKCDGKVRGSAMVVDTREFSTKLEGVVVLTAAHVIYDLEKNRRFRRCEFNFLGLAELAAYRARIDLKNVQMGGFEPTRSPGSLEFGEGDWVFLHIPKPWKSYSPGGEIALREFTKLQMESFQQNGGELRLIAFDSAAKVISVSQSCTVIESDSEDLGGGEWKGQLLDDCDSGDGASGGGIVAVLKDKLYLVGIRSGSHWSEQVFPTSDYPTGPQDGSLWNRNNNTNFARAIDAHLIRELAEFVRSLESGQSTL